MHFTLHSLRIVDAGLLIGQTVSFSKLLLKLPGIWISYSVREVQVKAISSIVAGEDPWFISLRTGTGKSPVLPLYHWCLTVSLATNQAPRQAEHSDSITCQDCVSEAPAGRKAAQIVHKQNKHD